ncbi:MAG: type IV secretory system conjugative DNA transfer family protein [Pseudomonadota bacterium]
MLSTNVKFSSVLLMYSLLAAPCVHAEDDDFEDITLNEITVVTNLSVPPKLSELTELESSTGTIDESLLGSLRNNTLRDAAYSLGSQAGLAWRDNEISVIHEDHADYLDRIYNFSPFLIDGKILSPVIIEAKRMYQQESSIRARTVNVSYTLFKNARIVPGAPTWRDYLVRPAVKVRLPDDRILPTNDEEQLIWVKAINQGWIDGIDLSEDIHITELRRLERDYTGMQKFRMLARQSIVEMPELSVGDFGVVKNGKTLNINDVVYEITEEADFSNVDKWKPVFRISGDNK